MNVNDSPSVANVFYIRHCDVLHAILILKEGFENLTIKRKSMVLIANIRTDLN